MSRLPFFDGFIEVQLTFKKLHIYKVYDLVGFNISTHT